MTKYVILTDNAGTWGTPVVGIGGDKPIRTDENGNPVNLSDLTESERQEIGRATLIEEDTTGYTPGAPSDDLQSDGLHRTYPNKTAIPVTVEQVQAECARRLAAGFDYDFEDARGVHTIATTDKDMEGWREVTDIANARLATSDTTAIGIATETGETQVTPLEWMDVLKAAAAFRQPIWAYSFALQAQDPIPQNYTDDEHWAE
jgi:hypothetical protein